MTHRLAPLTATEHKGKCEYEAMTPRHTTTPSGRVDKPAPYGKIEVWWLISKVQILQSGYQR